MTKLNTRLFSSVIYSSAGNLAVKFFAIIGYILIIRKLQLHDYGIFVLLTSLVGPVASIVLVSFDRIFVSSFAAARSRLQHGYMKGLLREYYLLSLVLLIGVFLVGYIFRDVLAHYYNFYLLSYFWPLVVFITSQLVMNLISLFLEANEKFKHISILETIEASSRTCLIIIAFFMIPFSVTTVLWIYTISKIIFCLVGLTFFISTYRQVFVSAIVAERRVIVNIIKTFGKWEMAKTLLAQLSQPVKPFALKFFVNIEAVAIYDFARNVYSACASALPLNSVIFPFIASNVDRTDILHLIVTKARKYSFLYASLMFVAVIIFTPLVIQYVFPQYIGSSIIVYLMVAHLFVDAYKSGQDGLVYAYKEQKFMFILLPLTIIAQIILDIAGAKVFGVSGTALSWHLGALLPGIVTAIYLSRKWNMPQTRLREILNFDAYDRMLLKKVFGRFRKLLPGSSA